MFSTVGLFFLPHFFYFCSSKNFSFYAFPSSSVFLLNFNRLKMYVLANLSFSFSFLCSLVIFSSISFSSYSSPNILSCVRNNHPSVCVYVCVRVSSRYVIMGKKGKLGSQAPSAGTICHRLFGALFLVPRARSLSL